MKKADQHAWMAKNERLNAGATLTVGTRVQDPWQRLGTVCHIRWPNPKDPSDNGTITVDLDAGHQEHYHTSNWTRVLRRTK